MEGKRRYVAIVLFLFIGLTIFAFANPIDNESAPVIKEKESTSDIEKNTIDGILETYKELEQPTTVSRVKQLQYVNVDTKYQTALAAVEKAEATLAFADVDTARGAIDTVTNNVQKDQLTQRINNIEETIKVMTLVEKLEQLVADASAKEKIDDSRNYRGDKEIIKKVNELRNEKVKNNLQKRLQILSRILDDEIAPTYEGIEDGAITNDNVLLIYSDINKETGIENEVNIKVTLNEKQIDYTESFALEGVYEVILLDEAFNETSLTFTIDKTPGTITLNGEPTITLEAGIDTYAEHGAKVEDDVDETKELLPSSIKYIDIYGNITTDVEKIDNMKIGQYNVTYTYTDIAGNKAVDVNETAHTYVMRTVNVVDTTASTISLLGNKTVIVEVGTTNPYVDEGAIVTDNVDASTKIFGTGIVDYNAIGDYTLTYEYKDAAGNASQAVTRTISVQETKIIFNNAVDSEWNGNEKIVTAKLLNNKNEVVSENILLTFYNFGTFGEEKTNEVKDIGIYKVKATFAGNEIFQAKTAEAEFTITPAQIHIESLSKNGNVLIPVFKNQSGEVITNNLLNYEVTYRIYRTVEFPLSYLSGYYLIDDISEAGEYKILVKKAALPINMNYSIIDYETTLTIE